MIERRTYTVSEIAQMLGIATSKAYVHVRNGDIPGVIVLGKRIMVRRLVFDEWLAAGKEGANAIGIVRKYGIGA